MLADRFPRCVGHVLLITRDHCPSHMSVKRARLGEFQAGVNLVSRFLHDCFGRAAFYENGGKRQEVPHAHLHGLPFEPQIDEQWVREGWLSPTDDWRGARKEWKRRGHYFYVATGGRGYLIHKYRKSLDAIRRQLVDQTEARFDPDRRHMLRGGPETVCATQELWRRWMNGVDAAPP